MLQSGHLLHTATLQGAVANGCGAVQCSAVRCGAVRCGVMWGGVVDVLCDVMCFVWGECEAHSCRNTCLLGNGSMLCAYCLLLAAQPWPPKVIRTDSENPLARGGYQMCSDIVNQRAVWRGMSRRAWDGESGCVGECESATVSKKLRLRRHVSERALASDGMCGRV